MFVVTLMAGLAANPGESRSFHIPQAVVACSVVVFTLGLLNQFGHAIRHLPEYSQRRNLERIAELNKWIADYARENRWLNPTISFDVTSGSLHACTITTSSFEALGQLIEFQPTVLGGAIIGASTEQKLLRRWLRVILRF